MNKPEATGRMVQWVIELSQFDIEYHPKTAIKAQALVYFVDEFTVPKEEEVQDDSERWTIQTEGLSTRKKRGTGVITITPEGNVLRYGVQLQYPTTNNVRLRIEKALGAKNLLLQSDSKLVIGQIKVEYKVKEDAMQRYLRLKKHLAQELVG